MFIVFQRAIDFIGIPCTVFVVAFLLTKKGGITVLFLLSLAISLLFFLWRFYILNTTVSSRYCSVLIYPVTIIMSYFLCETNILQKSNSFVSPLLRYLLPGIFIIYYLSFDFIVDSNKLYTFSVTDTLKCYFSKPETHLYVFNSWNEMYRLSHYTKIPPNEIIFLKANDISEISNQIDSFNNYFGNYLFFFTLHGHLFNDTFFPKQKGLQFVFSHATSSSKHNKNAYLFCYHPLHEKIKVLTSNPPESPADNICINGDFEEYLSGKQLDDFKQSLFNMGHTDYLSHDYLFPKRFTLGLSKDNAINPPLMCLSPETPISGNYSLLIDTTQTNNKAFFAYHGINKGNYAYSGLVKGLGKQPSELMVSPYYFDSEKQATVYLDTIRFNILPNITYQFSGTVSSYSISSSTFSLYFVGSGKLLFDNLNLVPTL